MKHKNHTKQHKNLKKLTAKILLHYLDFVVKHMPAHEIMTQFASSSVSNASNIAIKLALLSLIIPNAINEPHYSVPSVPVAIKTHPGSSLPDKPA